MVQYVCTPAEEKMFLIFPGVLEHSVSRNLSNEKRISLSFNFSWMKTIDQLGKILIVVGKYIFNLISKVSKNLFDATFLFFKKVRKIVTTLQVNPVGFIVLVDTKSHERQK